VETELSRMRMRLCRQDPEDITSSRRRKAMTGSTIEVEGFSTNYSSTGHGDQQP